MLKYLVLHIFVIQTKTLMKTVKSALLGAKQVNDSNQEAMLKQLTDIIKEHRAIIITRLISDLDTYLYYKFEFKPDKNQVVRIKENLYSLKNSGVNLEQYDNIVQQLLNRAQVHLTNEPFYAEIDEMLKWEANENKLKSAVHS